MKKFIAILLLYLPIISLSQDEAEFDWNKILTSNDGKENLLKKELKHGSIIPKEYVGQIGLMRYADHFYEGNMLKAYISVKNIVSPKELKALDWRMFKGYSGEFILIRDILFAGSSTIDTSRYYGVKEGLTIAAIDLLETLEVENNYDQEKFDKLKDHIKSALTTKERSSLGWNAKSITDIPKMKLQERIRSITKKIIDPKTSVKRVGKK